jgi:ATP-binding cassette subfamily B (MDR/TAP) protein 1
MITTRYNILLQEHVKNAFDKAKYSTLIFSLSDSVPLGCMALTFYYGGTLVASREYGAVAFFVVYIAVNNGGESAGSFLSFGPSKSNSALPHLLHCCT